MKAILENSVGIAWQKAEDMLTRSRSIAENYAIKKLTYYLTGDGSAQKAPLKELILRGTL